MVDTPNDMPSELKYTAKSMMVKCKKKKISDIEKRKKERKKEGKRERKKERKKIRKKERKKSKKKRKRQRK